MRVTSSMMLRSTLRDLSQGLSRLQEQQTKLSTGKEITRPSANPTATSSAMSMRQDLGRAEQRLRSLNDAQGWLQTAGSTLTASLTTLGRARETAVLAANTGVMSDPAARNALATEMRSIRSELLALANTTYGDRAIFNGTATGGAYDPSGAYSGNSASIIRDVAPSTSIEVNLTGPEIFGTAGGPVGDMFEVLDRLATAISNGDNAAMATELTNLDAATARVGAATVEVGTRSARLEEAKNRAEDNQLLLRTKLSEVEDVDIVETLVRVKAAESSYQATLQAAAKILPPSLLDYLR
jgi:flagellar hook-associated protein 3 FlgL